MKKILCIAPLVAASMAASTQAHAEWRTFVAHGHVTYATPTAPVGAKVTVRFSYDDDAAPLYTYGDGKGRGYSTAAYGFQAKMTMKVNGHVMTAATTRIDIVNNGGGNVEDSISVYGYPMVMDGTTFPEGIFGFYLGSGPGKTKVLKSTALPRKIDVKRYDSIGFQYGFAQVDGSSNGGLLNVVIDSVEEVDSRKDGDD